MRILLALVCLFAPITPVHAAFRASPPPPPFNGGRFECSIVREHPPARDPDPVYKINIDVSINSGRLDSIGVVHTVRSGKTYDRSGQYSDATIWKTPDRMEWYWQGYRGPIKMVGELYYNDRDGWMYSETISKNGRTEYQMLSDCHRLSGYDPAQPGHGTGVQQEGSGAPNKVQNEAVFSASSDARSEYTSLGKDCKVLWRAANERPLPPLPDSFRSICPGRNGMRVILEGGDSRSWIGLLPRATKYDNGTRLHFGWANFPEITGKQLEWRYHGRKLIALITRMTWTDRSSSGDARDVSSLIVWRVDPFKLDKNCAIGKTTSNEQARAIADDLSKPCLENDHATGGDGNSALAVDRETIGFFVVAQSGLEF
jgi:hypothetical protein